MAAADNYIAAKPNQPNRQRDNILSPEGGRAIMMKIVNASLAALVVAILGAGCAAHRVDISRPMGPTEGTAEEWNGYRATEEARTGVAHQREQQAYIDNNVSRDDVRTVVNNIADVVSLPLAILGVRQPDQFRGQYLPGTGLLGAPHWNAAWGAGNWGGGSGLSGNGVPGGCLARPGGKGYVCPNSPEFYELQQQYQGGGSSYVPPGSGAQRQDLPPAGQTQILADAKNGYGPCVPLNSQTETKVCRSRPDGRGTACLTFPQNTEDAMMETVVTELCDRLLGQ